MNKDDLWFEIVFLLQRLDERISEAEYQKHLDVFNLVTDVNTNDIRDSALEEARALHKELKLRLKEVNEQ